MKKTVYLIMVFFLFSFSLEASSVQEQCQHKINSMNNALDNYNSYVRHGKGPCNWGMYVENVLDNITTIKKHCIELFSEQERYSLYALEREMRSLPRCGSGYFDDYSGEAYWETTHTNNLPSVEATMNYLKKLEKQFSKEETEIGKKYKILKNKYGEPSNEFLKNGPEHCMLYPSVNKFICPDGGYFDNNKNYTFHEGETPRNVYNKTNEVPSTCTYYQTTVKMLNIRSAPSAKGYVLGRYRKGQICVYSTQNGWARTEHGWVSAKYIIENPRHPKTGVQCLKEIDDTFLCRDCTWFDKDLNYHDKTPHSTCG